MKKLFQFKGIVALVLISLMSPSLSAFAEQSEFEQAQLRIQISNEIANLTPEQRLILVNALESDITKMEQALAEAISSSRWNAAGYLGIRVPALFAGIGFSLGTIAGTVGGLSEMTKVMEEYIALRNEAGLIGDAIEGISRLRGRTTQPSLLDAFSRGYGTAIRQTINKNTPNLYGTLGLICISGFLLSSVFTEPLIVSEQQAKELQASVQTLKQKLELYKQVMQEVPVPNNG